MKVKFGSFIVAGSGKIGGHVASKNRGGAYLRTKVTPTNPNTTAQAGARALLASLATAWSGLTESQRDGWNAAVKDFATTDIFGDIKNPSGINLYVKLNANLVVSGQAQITNAPAKVEVPAVIITSVVYDVSTTGMSVIEFANNDLDGINCIISATPKVTPGTSFVKNLYRKILSAGIDGNELAYGLPYINKFGGLAVGDKFFIQVEAVMPNGQKSVGVTSVVYAVA